MTPSSKTIRAIGLTSVLLFGLVLVSRTAHSAIAPLVSPLTSISDGVSSPLRLASDQSGALYVTDPRGGGILMYRNDGTLLKAIPTASKPLGIAIALNGDLLVSQGTSVVVLNKTSGTQTTQFGTFTKANGIAVDANGTIYVTDSSNNCVQVFSPGYAPLTTGVAAAGKPANSFGTLGQLAGQFMQPTGITYEKQANQLAVVDTLNGRVQFFSPTGAYIKTLGSFGSGPLLFTSPQAIAFEYSPSDGSLSRIYVADAYQSNIQVIDAATGSFLSYVGSYGSVNGKLITPGDVLFDTFDSLNFRLIVPSGSGALALFGIDKVTGRCGSANGGLFGAPPAAGLCSYGLVANFSGSGPWNWTCAGQNGGTSSTCSANLPTHQLNLTIATASGGSGYVTINPAGITCASGVCSNVFGSANSVDLIPFANADSLFSGWSGDCGGTANCTLGMSVDRNATATFSVNPRSRVSGIYYGTLSKAYEAIGVSAIGTIEAQAQTFIENLSLNRGSAVTLLGGYDSGYGAVRTGYTTLSGTLLLGSGSLIVDRLVVK